MSYFLVAIFLATAHCILSGAVPDDSYNLKTADLPISIVATN